MMHYKLFLLAVLVTAHSIEAFVVSNPLTRTNAIATGTRIAMSDMTDDSPSDSSSEDFVDVEAENIEPTASDAVIGSIFDDIPLEGPATTISQETRAKINDAVLKLEAMNPTENPASSPLLNGVWTLRYAGGYDENWALPSPTRQIALFLYAGGYSPGLFALSLASSLPTNLVETGDLEISISREQPRVEAKIDVKLLGGASNDVVVKANLSAASDVRLTETYESATILDQTVDLPEVARYSRDIYIAYLDEDVLVIRDGSGVPEILVRKQ